MMADKTRRSAEAASRMLRRTLIYAMLGSVMFASKIAMEALPNIHLLSVLTMVYTVVFGWQGIIPVSVGILLIGLVYGFALWWVPYLYIFPILWAVTLLLPKKMKPGIAVPVYAVVCGLHGLLYGTLYAPFQALVYGFSVKTTLAWIASGFPFDVTMAIGNACLALLIVPLSSVLKKMDGKVMK